MSGPVWWLASPDPGVHARAQMADMHETRGSLAVVALHGKVYALGGGHPKINLDSIEVRSPAQVACQVMSAMLTVSLLSEPLEPSQLAALEVMCY